MENNIREMITLEKTLAAKLDVLDKVFSDPILLTRHLSVMKFNTQLEWFNIALVAVNQEASDAGFRLVLTEKEWNRNGISFPLKGRGIPLLFPVVFDKKLLWRVEHLYTVGDFGFEEPANESSIASILNVFDSDGTISDLCKKKDEGWQRDLFNSYLSSLKIEDVTLSSFFISALEMTWGSNLYLRTGIKSSSLKLSLEKHSAMETYQLLAETITGFPRFFIRWLNGQKTSKHSDSSLASLTLNLIEGIR